MIDHPRCRCVWVPLGDGSGTRLLVRRDVPLMGETFGTIFCRPPRWKRHDPLRGRVLEPDFRFNDARFGGDQIPMCRILY